MAYQSYSPGTGFYIAKVTDTVRQVETRRFNKALRWAIDNGTTIISVAVPISKIDAESESLFQEAYQKKILILVPASNRSLTKAESVLPLGASIDGGLFLPVIALNRQNTLCAEVFMPGVVLGMTHQSSRLKTLTGADTAVATGAGVLARTTDTTADGASESLEKNDCTTDV